jgi:hypothetical protein
MNFGLESGFLSRKRLAQVQIHHLSYMNIENFEHQKILMEHIRHAVKFAFQSTKRQKAVSERQAKREILQKEVANKKMEALKHLDHHASVAKNVNHFVGKMKVKAGIERPTRYLRHRTMSHNERVEHDKKMLQFIRKHADTSEKHGKRTHALSDLRAGIHDHPHGHSKKNEHHFTRSSEDEDNGVRIGRAALETHTILQKIHAMEKDHLTEVVEMTGAERCITFYQHEKSREIFTHINKKWYRLPPGSGVHSLSIEQAEHVNLTDAPHDSRHNANLDGKLGIHIHNLVCVPIRVIRGVSPIAGCVMLVNKEGGFSQADEELLASTMRTAATLFADYLIEMHSHIGDMVGAQVSSRK